MTSSINLSTLFNTVTQHLAEEQDTLNAADTYNHNHGDHMVKIFNLVENAVAQKSDQSTAEQLSYASKVVEEKADSGSAKLYVQGLEKAASRFSGKDLNENTVGILIQSLLGAEQPEQTSQTQSSNILGSVLSSLTGQTNEPVEQEVPPQSQSGDLLGSLLSGLTGGSAQTNETDQSLGLDDLLQAGMAFFQSKQNGETNMEAIMDALMASSPMGKTSHRAQSGSIVAATIMNFVKNLNK
jgi:hypothetical protein